MKYMNELKSLIKLNIPHKIIYTKFKRLVIKFDRHGILNVRCPKVCKFEEVEKFVNDHIDWIIENYKTKLKNVRTYNTGDEYLYLGKTYKLNVVLSRHTGVFIQNDEIIVYVSNYNDVLKELNKWKKVKAEEVFNEILFRSFKEMENDLRNYPKLVIKKYVSRWGCCYPKKNIIALNISLIHVPLNLIRFVVFHELTHFIHMNHQSGFHMYLRKFVPDESVLRKELNKYKVDYE